MPQSKDTEYQNGLKNKTHQYAPYKKLILDPKTPPDLCERVEDNLPCQWTSKESWGGNSYIRSIRF